MPINIGIAGAAGRMGRQIITAIHATQNAQAADEDKAVLAAALEIANHPQLGQDAAVLANLPSSNVMLADDFSPTEVDVFIDFSAPAAAIKLAKRCQEYNIALVIGATGFSEDEKKFLMTVAESIPLVMSPNMSIGVNVMFALAAEAAKMLQAGNLGGDYDIEVSESHHRHKKDAPSGTALHLGEVLAKATNVNFKDVAVFDRHGRDNVREAKDIGFSVTRGGDIVGEHRVMFAGEGEQLEIVHRSSNRANYAAGAVRAAIFAARKKANKQPGFYDINAVLSD
ncbi:MAG: 4-hydroxy-tetrahydrodipicolinate reductase [Gammaproteobacteria bacterium WSBS_2016_MAG_OTU1]